MKSIFLALAVAASTAPVWAAPATDTIPAKNSPIVVTALLHASTMLQYGPLTIYVDPIGAATYTRKADAILITHSHDDHLDLATKGIDAAFLPMNLPYTMTPGEAATAARAFRPKVVYPTHFRSPFDKPNGNAEKFAADLKGSGIAVKILDWYPRAAVEKMMGKK